MKTVKLEDICDVISRGISPKYTDSENGVIVLNQRCIRDKQILFEFARKHDVSAKKVQEIKYVMDGDMLVNSTGHGTLGRTALVEDNHQPILVDSHITIIRPKAGVLEPKYFAYLIGMCELDFVAMATGTSGQTELPRSLLNEYEISYAQSLEVQRDIVARLDAAFEKIDKAIELTQKNIGNVTDLFGIYIASHLRQKKSSNVTKKIGAVCELDQGLAINQKTKHLLVSKSSLPLLRIKDLKNNNSELYVNEKEYPIKTLVKEDDIIYSRTGQIGLVFRGRNGILHNNCFKITPNSTLDKDYLYWWLQDNAFRNKIIALASRAAQPDITHKIFKEQLIVIPDMETQKIVAEIISDLNSKKVLLLQSYNKKVDKLLLLKQSLLAEAFNSNGVQ